jgi:hypothetical protein
MALLCRITRIKFRSIHTSSLTTFSVLKDYSVDKVTARVRLPAGARDFSLLDSIHIGSGAHLASYPVGTGGRFTTGVMRQRSDVDHSLPSSAEVNNSGAIPSLALMPSWYSA